METKIISDFICQMKHSLNLFSDMDYRIFEVEHILMLKINWNFRIITDNFIENEKNIFNK